MLRQGVAAEVTGDLVTLTGRRPRSFAKFARDHVQLFEPTSYAPERA
jgi:hypothetical protein